MPGRIYQKPFLSHNQQFDKLKRDGLQFAGFSPSDVLSHLKRINYYRLSGYWFPFQEKDTQGNKTEQFIKNTQFSDIIKRCQFDTALRNIVIQGLSEIEITLRASWAYHIAEKHSPFAYESLAIYKRNTIKYAAQDIVREVLRKIESDFLHSKEQFIQHYKAAYTKPVLPPSWIIAEIISFGSLIKLTTFLDDKSDIEAIASDFQYSKTDFLGAIEFSGILRHLNIVRNICAHYGRLWNRSFNKWPIIPQNSPLLTKSLNLSSTSIAAQKNYNPKIYNNLCFINYLLCGSDIYQSWKNEIKALISAHSHYAPEAGFPVNWHCRDLWQ